MSCIGIALAIMWVGCMADLHHVIRQQHLMCDGLSHAGAESDECG